MYRPTVQWCASYPPLVNAMSTELETSEFEQAAQQMVELGNRLLDDDEEADSWEVASGLLAGAVHFWLYSRQPTGDLANDSEDEIDTAELRMKKLIVEVQHFSEDSEYYHTPLDSNSGSA